MNVSFFGRLKAANFLEKSAFGSSLALVPSALKNRPHSSGHSFPLRNRDFIHRGARHFSEQIPPKMEVFIARDYFRDIDKARVVPRRDNLRDLMAIVTYCINASCLCQGSRGFSANFPILDIIKKNAPRSAGSFIKGLNTKGKPLIKYYKKFL